MDRWYFHPTKLKDTWPESIVSRMMHSISSNKH